MGGYNMGFTTTQTTWPAGWITLASIDLLMLHPMCVLPDSPLAPQLVGTVFFQPNTDSYHHHRRSCPPCGSSAPLLFPQAQSTLVRSFKRLRGDDAAPGSHAAYRITVRQLEALVRLSEAVARVHCSPTVTAQHVNEVSGRAGWVSG